MIINRVEPSRSSTRCWQIADCQGTRELQPGLLRCHHVFSLVCTPKRNKSKDELRDAKSPSTDLIPRFIIICGEPKAAWGAELRKQHRPGPRGSQLNRDKQLRSWGSRMTEARRLVPDALSASSLTSLRAEGGYELEEKSKQGGAGAQSRGLESLFNLLAETV